MNKCEVVVLGGAGFVLVDFFLWHFCVDLSLACVVNVAKLFLVDLSPEYMESGETAGVEWKFVVCG